MYVQSIPEVPVFYQLLTQFRSYHAKQTQKKNMIEVEMTSPSCDDILSSVKLNSYMIAFSPQSDSPSTTAPLASTTPPTVRP